MRCWLRVQRCSEPCTPVSDLFVNVLKYLSGISWGADRKPLLMVYKSLIRSHLDYVSLVYGSASDATLRRLDVFQNVCLRMSWGPAVYTRRAFGG